jgi:hypothetical protein
MTVRNPPPFWTRRRDELNCKGAINTGAGSPPHHALKFDGADLETLRVEMSGAALPHASQLRRLSVPDPCSVHDKVECKMTSSGGFESYDPPRCGLDTHDAVCFSR